MQQVPLGCVDLVGDKALAFLEKFFHRRRQQQYRKILCMRPHGNDGVGQQGNQLLQLLVLLVGGGTG